MKIAIIRPLYDQEEEEFQEPCGAQAICGFLRDNGYECRVFDRRIGITIRNILEYAPDCAGFSVMTEGDMPDTLKLLQELKTVCRHFFAGGLFVTTEYNKAKALFPGGTFLISGEGEIAALNFLRSLENKPVFPKKILHPNDWSFQSRDNLGIYLEKGGVLNIRSSRGCRGTCTFCTTPGLPAEYRRFETRDIGLVVDEIEKALPCMSRPVVNFTDDEFGDLNRIEELVNELGKRNLKVAFSLELRAFEMVKADAGIWDRLHKGGLCRIFTGLESLNAETLKSWKKNVRPDKLIEQIGECKKTGIVCETGYILWHPGQSVNNALEEIRELHLHGLFSPKTAISRLYLFPGSELHNAYGKKGVYPAPLTDESLMYYDRIQNLISPLFELQNKCGVHLIHEACLSYLSGNESKKDRIIALQKEINRITFDTVMSMEAPDKSIITDLRRETDEICCTGERRR